LKKEEKPERPEGTETALDLSHLRRETRTALELAIVALAPGDLADQLAVVAGLLEAIAELPLENPPVTALFPIIARRGRTALNRWGEWYARHLASRKA